MGKWWQRHQKRLIESWKALLGCFFRVDSPPSTDPHDPLALGRLGERAAFKFLQHYGYKIVARNFRTVHGEIDLVAWDRDILCFVEVKTRATTEHGRPEEAVTTFKQRQILNTSLDYLRLANLHSVNTRFDIVSVQLSPGEVPVCQLIRRAFGSRMN
ncbi:MAG: YraN family protein [Terriglobia bacterium]